MREAGAVECEGGRGGEVEERILERRFCKNGDFWAGTTLFDELFSCSVFI